MDCSKNGKRTSPLKNFSRVRVKRDIFVTLHIKQSEICIYFEHSIIFIVLNWSCSSFNPKPPKFIKWNNPLSIFGTVHYHFYGHQNENLKFKVSLVRLYRWAGWPSSWLYTGGKGQSLSVPAAQGFINRWHWRL